jgi:hypothetical protein
MYEIIAGGLGGIPTVLDYHMPICVPLFNGKDTRAFAIEA